MNYLTSCWNSFLRFVNSNASLWSFLVTLATVIYVVLTYRLLTESVKARKLQVQPNIIVDLDVSGIFLKMIVKNVGNNSALNIEIDTEPEISNNPFSRIEFMASGREISNVIQYLTNDSKINLKYQFRVSYEDPFKERYAQSYNIDLSPIINATNFIDWNKDNKDIVDKLDKIVSKLGDIKSVVVKAANAADKQADTLKDLARKVK